MTPLVARARQSYGAHPLHLVLLLAGLALAAYAVQLVGLPALWNPDTWWKSIAVWFVGAALVHDLLLFPMYAGVDRILTAVTARSARPGRRTSSVPAVTYIRVPLLACGLVTLMFLPGIIRQGSAAYTRATGQTQEPFLQRWLLLCGAILLIGLIAYLVARRQAPTVIAESSRLGDAPAADALTGVARAQTPVPIWAVLVVVVLLALARRRDRGESIG